MINVNENRYPADLSAGVSDSGQVAAIKHKRQVIYVGVLDLLYDSAGTGKKSVYGRNWTWRMHGNFFIQLGQRQSQRHKRSYRIPIRFGMRSDQNMLTVLNMLNDLVHF